MAARKPDVVVYTQPSCPACAAEKDFLEQNGIEFSERDVTTDPAAADELRRHGIRMTPAMAVDGEFLIGFRPNRLLDRIRRTER